MSVDLLYYDMLYLVDILQLCIEFKIHIINKKTAS